MFATARILAIWRTAARALAAGAIGLAVAGAHAPAVRAATAALDIRVTMADGISLAATLTGEAPLVHVR